MIIPIFSPMMNVSPYC